MDDDTWRRSVGVPGLMRSARGAYASAIQARLARQVSTTCRATPASRGAPPEDGGPAPVTPTDRGLAGA
jgi:hypothetical protein